MNTKRRRVHTVDAIVLVTALLTSRPRIWFSVTPMGETTIITIDVETTWPQCEIHIIEEWHEPLH